ncbi:MAG: class I SAM-dependent methyltransferase [Leptospiraceae bacterium]|nr:class I SAM-dependent methyltransferase [Leptospiraceae bacterium]
MEEYLEKNLEYYNKGYEAENVEGWVFRPFGRIFNQRLGITGERGEKVLDFGCGSGASLRYLKSKGFNVYGVDISEVDINRAKSRMPDIRDNFQVIDPKPKSDQIFFGGEFDIVISIQTLYFLNKTDMNIVIDNLYNQLKKGGYIYVTMISAKTYYYKHSVESVDGLRKINYDNGRIKYDNLYCQFYQSQEEVNKIFSIFKKLFEGYYAYDWGDGDEEHFTFVGQKI